LAGQILPVLDGAGAGAAADCLGGAGALLGCCGGAGADEVLTGGAGVAGWATVTVVGAGQDCSAVLTTVWT